MGVQEYTTEQIIQALRDSNGLVSFAARRLGCSPNTIYNRAKRVQAVQQVINDSRDELVDIGEAKLRTLLLDGDTWAVGYVLRTLGKDRGYTERHEVTGADGNAIEIVIVDEAA